MRGVTPAMAGRSGKPAGASGEGVSVMVPLL